MVCLVEEGREHEVGGKIKCLYSLTCYDLIPFLECSESWLGNSNHFTLTLAAMVMGAPVVEGLRFVHSQS